MAVTLTEASSGPRFSIDRLASGSDAVVIGRVEEIAVDEDPAGDSLYTYITLRPSEILKGDFGFGPLVIKQLGGRLGGQADIVFGQAKFLVGEDVLVFLEVRPRDGTLYTSALWQGKWTLEVDPVTRQRIVVQREPEGTQAPASRLLSDVRSLVGGMSPSQREVDELTALPPERPQQSMPYELGDPAFRWNESTVLVHVETGTQPGLASGGLPEINAAIGQWNGVGSSLTLSPGPRRPQRCLGASDSTPFILITFNDPCNEISFDGNTVALARVSATDAGGQVIGGRQFWSITRATITTSNHPDARPFLVSSSCFQTTLAHEIGHALGLDHSSDPTALMYFAETGECFQAVHPIAPDDRNGLLAIYPSTGGGTPGGGTGGVPGQTTVTSATVSGDVLTITWTATVGAPPSAHRFDFYAGGVLAQSLTVGAQLTPSVSFSIPPGVQGSFTVRVPALSGATAGPTSAPFPFTIGPSCAAPVAPVVSGSVVAGTATVTWLPQPGMTFLVQAGTTQGSANLFPQTNVGGGTTVSGSGLPAGFTAWVRVIAVNACSQQSTPTDFFLR